MLRLPSWLLMTASQGTVLAALLMPRGVTHDIALYIATPPSMLERNQICV